MVTVKRHSFGSMANNCYIITDNATLRSALVDCTEDSGDMRRFVEGSSIDYILLTHGHFDHISGCKAVKELTGARIVIHKNDASMLTSARDSLAVFCGAVQNNVEPDILVTDGDVITLGESVISVIHTPGHTSGSVCYVVDDCIFTGDTLFKCSYGRTDFPSGSVDDMAQSLKKIVSLDGDYKVYTGHEAVTTLNFERENNIELQMLINR